MDRGKYRQRATTANARDEKIRRINETSGILYYFHFFNNLLLYSLFKDYIFLKIILGSSEANIMTRSGIADLCNKLKKFELYNKRVRDVIWPFLDLSTRERKWREIMRF